MIVVAVSAIASRGRRPRRSTNQAPPPRASSSAAAATTSIRWSSASEDSTPSVRVATSTTAPSELGGTAPLPGGPASRSVESASTRHVPDPSTDPTSKVAVPSGPSSTVSGRSGVPSAVTGRVQATTVPSAVRSSV